MFGLGQLRVQMCRLNALERLAMICQHAMSSEEETQRDKSS